MKVKELIEKLAQFDPELEVMTMGFDDFGRDRVGTVELDTVVRVEAEGEVTMHGSEFAGWNAQWGKTDTGEEPIGEPFQVLFIDR